ncbi:hypothetical protein CLV35_3336 [Motilibacter peucedani]|uniref:DUF6457 domain-containing protein n=1 Tax=Motilibacter peucedani TaxID=598650 RepID=A0A420XKJ7_9ACTN|nr:DUF6457 domain-containing protein [Motilibacter peucedani]RKS69162.1 hypothetical protein CLV35_3336 [Motilibacter peucedani]
MTEGPTLDEWTAQVAEALGLPPELAGLDARQLVLDLARDVAHGVARPAAPLTTFLAGVAAGRAGGSLADLRTAADDVRRQLPAD